MSMQIGNGGAMSETKFSENASHAADDSPHIEPPEPLLRQRHRGLALPLDYLGPLREPLEAIAKLTDAPIEIAFQSVLGTAALCTQHICDVETLAGPAPLSLFLLTVAASGERKSSCDKLASKPIQDWEEAQHADYLQRQKEYEFECEVFENVKRKALKSKADGEDVVEDSPPQPPIAPIVPRKLLSDITFEGLLRHFEDGDPSIGIFADEGGQFFGGHGMGKDNQLKTAAGLSKLWDAAALNRTRAGSAQVTYRHRRGSLHMMIQPGIAEAVLRNEILRDQGLLSRMLVAWPESRIGRRLIVVSDGEAEERHKATEALERYQSNVARLLRRQPQTRAEGLELVPRQLALEQTARAGLIQFANAIERSQAPNQSLAHITGFASKAAEQAARIAGTLAVFADPDATRVTAHFMECGTKIAAWYVAEAQRLLDAGPVDQNLQQAQALLDWLKAKHPEQPFDKRTIVRCGPTAIRDTKTVQRLLAVLVEHRHIRLRPKGAVVKGQLGLQTWELCTND